ncbi:MAG TPA: alpha/beta fold hydrolase [Syntrophomonadaceae bacterium]|nr:alpha/beta fold hydrolase [Syntrophomonadaceae bacterium]
MNNNDHILSNWHYYLPIYAHNSFKHWDKTILSKVDSLIDCQDPFCVVNEQVDPDLITAFGTSTPAPANYLLHLAPGWDKNIIKTPVILVHGAGLDSTSYTNIYNMGYTGLQQQLVALGYRVFSITFAHSHGDNFYQAEVLAHAIDRVKQLSNTAKVNIVAHSKGGFAARIYLSNLSKTPYQDDVEHYVMLGTPNMGSDYAFRYPSISYSIYLASGNGVIAWDKLLFLGNFIDISPRSIYHDGCFSGQSQMLYRLDDEFPLDITQQDWWTTYYGGNGFMSSSRGIDVAIADGGNLVTKLEKQGLEPGIKFSVLAGDNSMFFEVTPSIDSLPNDGIVFVDSVLNTAGLAKQGALLQEKTILPLNHMEILYDRKVASWIDRQLNG